MTTKKLKELYEEAILKNLETFGSPDISGDLEYDEETDMFYFKDASGRTSLITCGKIIRAWRKQMEGE